MPIVSYVKQQNKQTTPKTKLHATSALAYICTTHYGSSSSLPHKHNTVQCVCLLSFDLASRAFLFRSTAWGSACRWEECIQVQTIAPKSCWECGAHTAGHWAHEEILFKGFLFANTSNTLTSVLAHGWMHDAVWLDAGRPRRHLITCGTAMTWVWNYRGNCGNLSPLFTINSCS